MKTRTCKHCRTRHPESRLISTRQGLFCSVECISLYAADKDQLAKARKYHQKTQQKDRREKKKNFRDSDRSYQLKEAQRAFNAFIRKRDEKEPCISCQRHHKGQYHAGHFRTTKAAPQLRFNQFNVSKQCSACNTHLSGNITEYRINLVKKFGSDKVEELETNNDIKKWTLEEIKSIRQYYTWMVRRVG